MTIASEAPGSAEPASIEPVAMTTAGVLDEAPSKPLWRFALIGLGPLTAMGIFALLVGLSDRLS